MSNVNETSTCTSLSTPFPPCPREIYESFIDACSFLIKDSIHQDLSDVYNSLRACSLTCKTWYPRARLNLYSHLKLISTSQLAKFCSTLGEKPYYAEFVRHLSIAMSQGSASARRDGFGVHTSIVHAAAILTLLSSRFPHLRHITVISTPFRPHSSFFACVSQFRHLTSIRLLGSSFHDMKELVQFVATFRKTLKTLSVVQNMPRPARQRFSEVWVTKRRLEALETLHIELGPELTELRPNDDEAVRLPRSGLGACHFVEWLIDSYSLTNLSRLWIVFTIEPEPRYDKVGLLHRLFETIGNSLMEIVISIQLPAPDPETGEISVQEQDVFYALNGLSLGELGHLHSVHLLHMPWSFLSWIFPSFIATCKAPQIHLISVSFLQHAAFNSIYHTFAQIVDQDEGGGGGGDDSNNGGVKETVTSLDPNLDPSQFRTETFLPLENIIMGNHRSLRGFFVDVSAFRPRPPAIPGSKPLALGKPTKMEPGMLMAMESLHQMLPQMSQWGLLRSMLIEEVNWQQSWGLL